MSCHARVLVVEGDSATTRRLAPPLAAEGCTVVTLALENGALERLAEAHADVIIMDAESNPGPVLALTRALKAEPLTARIPVLMLSRPADRKARMQGLKAGVDDFLADSFDDEELIARVGRLARLATMSAELARRAATTSRYGLPADEGPAKRTRGRGRAVVAVGELGADRAKLEAVVGKTDRLRLVADPFEALEALAQKPPDAVVVAVGPSPARALELLDDIRSNPRLFHLPILLLADGMSFADRGEPYRRGANDVLVRPLDTQELKARLSGLVKQERFRHQMQEVYRRAAHLETADGLTGFYGHGFLHDHLASLIEEAERWDKRLSVGFLDVIRMVRINERFGYACGDKLLRQLASLISHLVRGEDLTARYGGEEFCIVMPDTDEAVAANVIRRITGVVSHTEFAVLDVNEPLMVALGGGCASYRPGDTAESLIARARVARR